MSKDYYKVLDVPRTATAEEIKKAHRKLARKHHPDLNPGDKKAEEQFKQIQEAYDVLSDEEKRRKFDQFGDAFAGSPFGGGAGTGPQGGPRYRTEEYADPFANVEYETQADFSGFFDQFFGARNTPPKRSAAPTEDVEFKLDVTLEEAYRGAAKRISVTVQDICPECDGTGQKKDNKGRFDLHGTLCPRCHGSGRIPSPRTGQVDIPAGAWDGIRLKLAGQGAAGAKGRRGDLFVVLNILPHPKFEREGQNLQFDVAVPYTIAALGGEVSVETLDGKRRQLVVPPGIQTGQKMRLTGQGMPALRDRTVGDAMARVKITVPKDLNERERALLTELADIRRDSIKK